MNDLKATIVNAQQGTTVSVVGDTYRIIIAGKETNNAYSVIDMLVPHGGGPGPHSHKDYQEAFYVQEGKIQIMTTSQNYTARKGDYVLIPPEDLPHSFKNLSNDVARLLCIITPAGMEKMFEEIGKPVENGKLLPPPEMTPEVMENFKAIAEKYGQKLYPSDYFDK